MIVGFILPEVHNIVLHGLRVDTGLAVQSGTPEIQLGYVCAIPLAAHHRD
jgi:hypothetical protein